MKIKKMITIVSMVVFVVSLGALGSESVLPFATLFASEAWLVYVMREYDMNNGKDSRK